MKPNFAGTTSGDFVGADVLPLNDLSHNGQRQFVVIDDKVMLRGSQSASSASKAFPQREVCLETGSRDMEEMLFGPFGTLYSFAAVHVSGTRPTPYTIGYVDFENGVRVLGQLEGPETSFHCDQAVELRADGDRWFFVPAPAAQARKSV